MNKSYMSIINKDYSSRQNFYLKDPKSDTFLILKEKIYPIHKIFFTEAEYFTTSGSDDQKVHMMNSNLDVLMFLVQEKQFEAVIGYFYGKQIKFFRNWDIPKLLQVITTLKINTIYKIIMNDIKANFDQYGFFLLMFIGEKFKAKWLKQKCQQELLLMGFQQLNFNKYDLMQVDREMFQQIIKLHELLKINQNIIGLKDSQLKRIIKQYCTVNKISDKQADKICELTVSTQPKLPKIQLSGSLTKKITGSSDNKNTLKGSNRGNFSNSNTKEQQNEEVYKLRYINSEMQGKNNQLIQEMKNVKSSIEKSGNLLKLQSIKGQNQQIDEKIRKYQQLYKQQDTKYLNLKAQMQKMNYLSSSKKSSQSEAQVSIKPIGSSTGSTKDNQIKSTRSRKLSQTINQKSTFPQMPRLSKDFQ